MNVLAWNMERRFWVVKCDYGIWLDKNLRCPEYNLISYKHNLLCTCMLLKPVSKSLDVSVIERQGHITNRIRLAELSEQPIHWLNPLCSSWEHAVVLQHSMHSCRRHFLFYLDKSKVYIMIDESSVQLYIFSLAENARKCYSMLERWVFVWG